MPPKKKNKPSKNGFWPFVMECRDKAQNKNMNMEQVKEYAARKWANMTKEEKAKYEGMARLAKENYNPVRLTSEGVSVDQINRIEEEKQAKIAEMKADIKETLKLDQTYNSLDRRIFFIIHINHLIHHEVKDRYYICEISIACFNLQNGVNINDVFHEVVMPGKLPLGTYGPAKLHSKETHKMIEIVQDEPYEDNTQEVFSKMIRYLRKYSKNKLPILYTAQKTMQMTKKVLDTFCDDFGFTEEFKVYELEYMFFVLKNTAAGEAVWPTEAFSYSEIERDLFSLVPKLACDYHETADITVYCSRSIVIRYGFTICNCCCPDLGIQVIPGKHVPENSKIKYGSAPSTRCNSVSSLCSDSSNNYRHQTREESLVDSSTFDLNFPSLGASRRSNASSVSSMSFRTMNRSIPASHASAISDTLDSLTLTDEQVPQRPAIQRPNIRNLKFPPKGFSSQESQSQ